MPILTLFSGISAKKQPFFWHNKVADIYVRRKHERKQNEHTTQGIRRSPPEKTHAGKSPQDGMAVRADTGACTGSGGHVSVPAEDSHCLCQNRNENKPPVRTGTQGKAVSETGTGCGPRRPSASGRNCLCFPCDSSLLCNRNELHLPYSPPLPAEKDRTKPCNKPFFLLKPPRTRRKKPRRKTFGTFSVD